MSKIPSAPTLNVAERRVYEEVTRLGFDVSPVSRIGGYAMTYAADAVGATCVRVDMDDFSGDVVEHIRTLINRSVAVLGAA